MRYIFLPYFHFPLFRFQRIQVAFIITDIIGSQLPLLPPPPTKKQTNKKQRKKQSRVKSRWIGFLYVF